MMNNVSSQPANHSYFSFLWNNPITNFVSGVGAYFLEAADTPREPSIPHAPLDIATSMPLESEALPVENEAPLPQIQESEAPPKIKFKEPDLPTSFGVQVLPVMKHPFISEEDEKAYALAHEKALVVLQEKKQRLDKAEAKLEVVEKKRFSSLEDGHLYLAVLKICSRYRNEYYELKGIEGKQAFERQLGRTIREAILPRLSINDDEKALVTSQIICLPLDNLNHFAAWITVSSETKQIEGALRAEGLDREVGNIRVLHFLTSEEIKQSSPDALFEIFPKPVVTYLQQRVNTL
jgi:hypothetical protein